jgi:hypothetical protein
MTDSSLTIPSKETIEYGRRVIMKEIELFRRWQKEAETPEQQMQWRKVANILEMKFIGGEGCVIRPFDKRWLDDEFRVSMGKVYNDINSGS